MTNIPTEPVVIGKAAAATVTAPLHDPADEVLDVDPELQLAAMTVVTEARASTSFLQRKLGIGFNKAADLIDRLEASGVVTAPDHVGKRLVLIDTDAPLRDIQRAIASAPSSGCAPLTAPSITITAPGAAPVTLTEAQLKKAAARAAKGNSMTDNKESRHAVKKGHEAGNLDTTTREKLRQTVLKIERLEEEKKGVADDIKEVYAEAKAIGFDTKAVRQLIRERKKESAVREEEQLVFDTYWAAAGDA